MTKISCRDPYDRGHTFQFSLLLPRKAQIWLREVTWAIELYVHLLAITWASLWSAINSLISLYKKMKRGKCGTLGFNLRARDVSFRKGKQILRKKLPGCCEGLAAATWTPQLAVLGVQGAGGSTAAPRREPRCPGPAPCGVQRSPNSHPPLVPRGLKWEMRIVCRNVTCRVLPGTCFGSRDDWQQH